ncbi:MAG: pilus assembly protein TadG-related protein [Myxococcota bacterium]|nr:pilus assembly protein TadG-related protein [Myxococcota bacterium]
MSIVRTRQRKGAVLVFIAIALVVLFGFAALAIDLSYHRTLQLQAQNAADAASYAGMVALRESDDETEAYNVALAILERHKVGGEIPSADIVIGEWDFNSESFSEGPNPNAVQVAVLRDNTTTTGGPIGFFGPALGYTLPQVTADATAAIHPRDIVFIMDQSTSMVSTVSYAKEGLLAALDVVKESDPNGLDRVALVGFSEGAQVMTPLQEATSNYGTLYSDWNDELCICGLDWSGYSSYYGNQNWQYPYGSNHHPRTPGDYAYGGETHADLAVPCCYPYCSSSSRNPSVYPGYGGTTNTAEAARVAYEHLSTFGRNTSYKLIVFLGDGQPNCSGLRYAAGACSSHSEVISLTETYLDAAEAEYINTTTMFFNASGSDAYGEAVFEGFVRGDGKAFATSDKDELKEMFEAAVRTHVALVE